MQISQNTMPIALALRNARRVLPIRGWERMFRLMFEPDSQASYEFERRLYEGTYISNAARFIDWYALFYGAYERSNIESMRELLSKMESPTVLDVGANTGHHSIAIGALARQVHAFEPYRPVREILERNVARNRHMSITVHPIALSSSNGYQRFDVPTSNNTGTGKLHPNGSTEVQCRIGDDYLEEIGCSAVHMIKIDVEGHELHTLQGLRRTIARDLPLLIIEANGGAASLRPALPPEYEFFCVSRCGLIRLRDESCGVDAFCFPSHGTHPRRTRANNVTFDRRQRFRKLLKCRS